MTHRERRGWRPAQLTPNSIACRKRGRGGGNTSRARAIIAVLLGRALRRSEVAALADGRCSGGCSARGGRVIPAPWVRQPAHVDYFRMP